MSQQPEPPESLPPQYLAEGLSKQNPETLRDLEHYAHQLAEYKEKEIHCHTGIPSLIGG